MVARLFDACGSPVGSMTSHIPRAPLRRPPSGETATGLRMQSEFEPLAWLVDEPSKPQSGSCSSVGNESKSLSWVLPRRLGAGVWPSSHMYSSLYFVITVSLLVCEVRCVDADVFEACAAKSGGHPPPPADS